MITDEQVNAFINAFELNGGHFLGNNKFDNVRKVLGPYEQSKWVKFDIDDESTHPQNLQHVIVLYRTGVVGSDKWSILKTWMFSGCKECVTHWQPLPEFKE